MTEQELLKAAKTWLRITTEAFDDEILQTIAAARLDLAAGGVVRIELGDELIQQAVKLYLKAQFGYIDGENKFAQAYEHLKAALALSGDYNGMGGAEHA